MPSTVSVCLSGPKMIGGLKAHGVAVLLVEQKVEAALEVADRVAFLENGAIKHEATPAALASCLIRSLFAVLNGIIGKLIRPGNPSGVRITPDTISEIAEIQLSTLIVPSRLDRASA